LQLIIRYFIAIICLLVLAPASAQTVTLRKTFVDSLKDKVTFSGTFDVFRFTGKASEDGDAHGVVSSGIIGLPCVAELMDKRNHRAAAAAIRSALEKNDSIRLKGAWRMWWEHAGKGDQVQGGIYNLETANEAHIFEIHPLLEVDTHKIYRSFIPKGFHQPAKAFAAYRKRECILVANEKGISITSKMTGYNYVHVLVARPQPGNIEQLEDGLRVKTLVTDSAGAMIGKEETVVIMAGTPAADKFSKLKKGEVMEVVVMPRLSFNAVLQHIEKVPLNTPVTVPIPYELVIVGLLER
jgi:hypothetical protein